MTSKTTSLTFSIDPCLKEAQREVAVLKHRSIANMIEVLIRSYFVRNRIEINEEPGVGNNKESKGS